MTNNKQRIGLHVSAAGGVENAPERANEFGAEVFQFFSRSPRGGKMPSINEEQVKIFKASSKKYGMKSYIHTPYYINFASKNKNIYEGSIITVREELKRGSILGVKYVMTHMGSAKDFIEQNKKLSGKHGKQVNNKSKVPASALRIAIEGLKKIYENNQYFSTKLLLEISAGAGAVLGDSFEELAVLLKGLGRKDVFVCLDTCHMFASGYDLRDKEAINKTMTQFRKHIGISKLKLVHANDSKFEIGEHKDRHEHIGKGKIGVAGFKALLKHPDFKNVNFILETKHDDELNNDIKFLKKYRLKK